MSAARFNILLALTDSSYCQTARQELQELQHILPTLRDGPKRKWTRKRIRRLQLWINAPITERRVDAALTLLGWRYITQKPIWLKNKTQRFIDFYFPTPHRMALELDGANHSAITNAAWDADVRSRLRNIRIVRISNADVAKCADDMELVALLETRLQPLFSETKTGVLNGSNVSGTSHRG